MLSVLTKHLQNSKQAKKKPLALTGMGSWVVCYPTKQKVTS